MTGRIFRAMMRAMAALRNRLATCAAFALALASARPASGATGPGCDVSCADQDGDGFPSCACAARDPCDCNDSDPLVFPGAPEACDSPRDRNCNGAVGESCGKGRGCAIGQCLPECKDLDDFGCAPRSTLTRQPSGQCLCVPDDCAVYGCGPGLTCDVAARVCVPNCNPGVACPFGQICRGFGCVDPCAGVACERGAVCERGACVPSCDCPAARACPAGLACDPGANAGRCVQPACVGATCPGASHCVGGRCVDDCDGVVCPPRLFCRHVAAGDVIVAACVDLCAKVRCDALSTCDYRDGTCVTNPLPDAGQLRPVDETPREELTVLGAGFRCTAAHGAAGASAPVLVFALAQIALAVRRRRR